MSEPKWVAKKAAFDALDDGLGPYLHWAFRDEQEVEQIIDQWQEFLKLADKYLGQGYSVACYDGHILDSITDHSFEWYMIGQNSVKDTKNVNG